MRAKRDVSQVLGVPGVSNRENQQAQLWARRFEWPMVMLAIWIPFQWYFESSRLITFDTSRLANWAVWSVFVCETTLITATATRKLTYLRQNWMNLVIILAGFPVFWEAVPLFASLRGLRIVFLVGALHRTMRTVQDVLKSNKLGATLLASFIIIVIFGVTISAIDPEVKSPFDGIWWAWVTVTTVGYGDIVPSSVAGRIIGALLILLGVGLFALLTANLSALFIGRDMTGVEKEVEEVEREIEEVEFEESRILRKLDEMEKRLKRIEKKLKS